MSKPVRFGSLKFLLNMTEEYATNITFTFDVVLCPGDNFVYTFFLTLEFDIIFELFVPEYNGYRLRIFFVWESMVPKSCRLKRITHFSSPFLIIVCAGQLGKREPWLIIAEFTHCGSKCDSEL